jgi:hypothetical protein
MFESILEKTFYIFGAGNLLTIPIVWAFYPESELQYPSMAGVVLTSVYR